MAKAPSITTEDLAGERLMLLSEGHCLRDQALALCSSQDGRSGTGISGADYRATSLETLRHLVATGAGVTLLPALAVPDEEDRRLAIRPLAERASRCIALIWRRNDPRSDAYGQLSSTIRRASPSGVIRR